MKPFSAELSQAWMPSIRLVATDMDGTMTKGGKFNSCLLSQLEALRQQGISVLIVTGRSAGWVSALVEYLPIAGAIAENGGYLLTSDRLTGLPLIEMADNARSSLADTFHRLKHQFPDIVPSADNQFRLTDWTFDRKNLELEQLDTMATICQQQGWDFTYSSIQCHIKSPQQSKQHGLLRAIEVLWGSPLDTKEILTIGDSPNDAELLDANVFPYSVGVANLAPYLEALPTSPRWMSALEELEGFLEVTGALLTQEMVP